MKRSIEGFAFLEVLISLILILTFTQLLLCFFTVLLKGAKHSERIFYASVQDENHAELMRANVLGLTSYQQHFDKKFTLLIPASSPSMRAQLDLQNWELENANFLANNTHSIERSNLQ